MVRLADPVLVVLVGASASGKSTWAAEHFAPDQIVSSDRLRAVVGEGEHDLAASGDAFAVLEAIVAARVGRRLTTVVDTLGLDVDRRRRWREVAARHRVPCVAVAFDTDAAECRRRNGTRAHRVPRAVLGRQLKEYGEQRALLAAEGFAEVLAAQPVRVVPRGMADAARSVPGHAGAVEAGVVDAGAVDTGPVEAGAALAAPLGRGRALRFGLHLSVFDVPGGPAVLGERLVDVAVAAERVGFTSLWVMDHLRQIPQLGRAWEDMPESTATLGFLAAATRSVSIGCLVNCVTYRNVAHLAKIVATLDVLSGGRAWCGVGAGWFEAEHTAYGWPFPPAAERLDLLEDALRLLPQMWGPGSKPFEGSVIRIPETMCYPRPLRSPVPILVGGSGEKRTLRLVAQHADACNVTGDLATVRHKVEVLRQHCADVGRDAAQIEVTHLSTALVAADADELEREVARLRPDRGVRRWAATTNPGTVEDHVLRARALQAAGVDHVIVRLAGVWDSPAIDRFGEVIAAFEG